VILTELSVVGVVRPAVAPLPKLRPFRTLRGTVAATVEGVIFSESAHAFPTRRSNPGCLPHFGRPFNPHRTQTALRQIEQWVPARSEPLDPFDLCPSEFFEAFYSIKVVDDDIIAVVHSKPIVERGLPS
jgi:hypothetical protein